MDEVGTALIAIALVLCSVFVPSAFITGISGQFYRQFALTIAGATVISLTVSLTLSPALCAHAAQAAYAEHAKPTAGGMRRSTASSASSIAVSTALTRGYGALSARLVRIAVLMLVVYAGVIAFGLNEFRQTPIGFIPQLDRGYLIIVTQLPPAASLARTDDGQPPRRRDRAEGAGRRPCGEHRRLLRRDLHPRAECGRGLPHARCRSSSAQRDPRQSAAAIQRPTVPAAVQRSRKA